MTTPIRPEPSALRTWAMALGFLIALLVALGGFAYVIKSARHAQGAPPAAGKPAG